MSYVEGFPKTYDMPLFLANWKTLITIKQWGYGMATKFFPIAIWKTPAMEWQLKNFGRPKGHGGMRFFQNWYYMHLPLFWRSKNFNRHPTYPTIRWQPKGVGPMLSFLGKFFFPFLQSWNQRILVAIQWCGCLGWWPEFFSCHSTMGLCRTTIKVFLSPFDTPPLFNGDQKQIQSPKKAWGEGHEIITITKGG